MEANTETTQTTAPAEGFVEVPKLEFMPYSIMVGTLFKKDDYVLELNNLVHAAFGILGEAVELLYASDDKNLIEEFGDLEFYVDAMLQYLPPGSYTDFNKHVAEHELEGYSFADLTKHAMDVHNFVKKLWVYRKPIDQVLAQLVESLAMVQISLLSLYATHGTNQTDVRYANQLKLIGPNGRYRDAVYSDAAAQARADKPAGE